MYPEAAKKIQGSCWCWETLPEPFNTDAGTWESQALSPAVMELHEDVAWLPETGQFQREAVCICAVSSQGCWEKPAC